MMSERRFRQIIENISDVIFEVDERGAITYVTPVGSRFWGGDLDDILGRDFMELIHPEDRKLLAERFSELQQGIEHPETYRFINKAGEILWVRSFTKPIFEEGRFKGAIGTLIDLTAQKRTEEALRKSEALLSATQRLAGVGGWEWDVATQSMTWSEEVYRIHDLDRSEFPSGSPEHIAGSLACYLPEDRPVILDVFQRCLEQGAPYDLELPFVTAKGRRRWIRTVAEAVRVDGRTAKVVGNIIDITERRLAEEALRESESNLEAMISASPESAFLLDPEGLVVCCNPVAAKRLELRPEDIIGRSIYDFLPPGVAASRREYVKQVVRTGEPLHFEDIRRGRFFSHYLHPVLDNRKGVVNRVAVFGHDITEYKKVEADLRSQKDLLASIRQAQSFFISGLDPRWVHQNMLHILVQHTGSEFGFLDEVLYEPDGTPYKLSLALSDISWDGESRRLYEQLVERKLEFRNLSNLSGAPVLEGRTIIANNVPRHPCYQGIPHGHPPLTSYMGIPLYFGKEIIGVAGVANRPEGYDETIAEALEPLLQACAAMIWAGRVSRRERENLAVLKSSEEKYRRIAETAKEGIWAMDGQYTTTYVNQRMAEMLGYRPEEMLGRQVDSFMLAEDLADHSAQMSTRRKGREGIYERRFRHKEGSVVWTIVSATAIEDEQGDFAGSFAMFNDITERKAAEEALRKSEEKFQAIANYTLDWESWFGPEGNYLWVNPAVEQFTGYSVEEILAMPDFISTVIAEEDRPVFIARFQEAIGGSHGENFEFRYLHKNGGKRWLNVSWQPIYDAKGNPLGTRASGRDITDRKRMEEQVRHLQKAESLSRMAEAVAHHFNNQLGVVLGNLELALDDLTPYAGASENINEAMRAARKAGEVSTLMLTYLGQATGKHERLDLSEVCSRSMSMIQGAIPKGVLLETDLSSPGPAIRGNANQIQQLLTNLITNGWEAIGSNQGTIHLTVGMLSPADISASHRFPIEWQPEDIPHACLEVRDTGCGIGLEDMEKLFDPFFSTKFAGRGLGLSVALGIVKGHGGAIQVESQPGRGSSFRVYLPLGAQELDVRTGKGAQAPQMEWGGTVLLVEDDEPLRKMASVMLTRLGFTVIAAKDGAEAVEIFRDRRDEVCLVLSDLTMPRMNGWETLAALRRMRPDIPVILTSGYDEAHAMAGDHAEQPQVFLHKPYGKPGLKAAVGKALGDSVPSAE
jgi:PAS domain S-box-containing protein